MSPTFVGQFVRQHGHGHGRGEAGAGVGGARDVFHGYAVRDAHLVQRMHGLCGVLVASPLVDDCSLLELLVLSELAGRHHPQDAHDLRVDLRGDIVLLVRDLDRDVDDLAGLEQSTRHHPSLDCEPEQTVLPDVEPGDVHLDEQLLAAEVVQTARAV